jgi:hypothetical protein
MLHDLFENKFNKSPFAKFVKSCLSYTVIQISENSIAGSSTDLELRLKLMPKYDPSKQFFDLLDLVRVGIFSYANYV